MRTSGWICPPKPLSIFHNMLRKLSKTFAPQYMAAIFESLGKTHREEEYAEYKANRSETPPDLIAQVPYIERLLQALRIPIIQYPGFEADDVIGTLSLEGRRGRLRSRDRVAATSDMLQLVTDRVSMLNPAKDDTWYDPGKVKEFMGVEPRQRGGPSGPGKAMPSTTSPGAPGIGEKGARDLHRPVRFRPRRLDRAAEVTKRMSRESLLNNRERIEMSLRLATIHCDVPIPFDPAALRSSSSPISNRSSLYIRSLEFFLASQRARARRRTPGRGISRPSSPRMPCAPSSKGYLEHWECLSVAFLPHQNEIGLACRPSEARSLPAARLGELQFALENPDLPKASNDLKSLTLSLLKAGIEPRGLRDDVSVYAFLLDADPALVRSKRRSSAASICAWGRARRRARKLHP